MWYGISRIPTEGTSLSVSGLADGVNSHLFFMLKLTAQIVADGQEHNYLKQDSDQQ